MSAIDLYHSKQRQSKQSRADLATSWRTSYPNTSGVYAYSDSQPSSGTVIEYLKSIWTDIPNTVSSPHNPYYGERQGVENPVNFYDNNHASSDLAPLFPLLSLYPQDKNKPLLAHTFQTETAEEPSLLGMYTGQQSQVDNKASNIPWSQVPNTVQQEHTMSSWNTWPQVVSGDIEEGLDSSVTLVDTEDTVVDKTSNNGRSVRYISQSYFTASLKGTPVFTAVPPPKPYTVLKIQNIPWYSSINDIKKLLSRDFIIPPVKEHPLSIHMLMDRCTGKTCGVAFAEVIPKSRNLVELRDIFNKLEKSPLQGRRLRICLSSYDQLREKLFYDWPGTFKDGVAITSNNEHDDHPPDLFVCQKDFQSIQNVCRNFKLCYNRKCPERSFEYLMSLVMNIPWLQTKAVVTWQRDLMYESYKLATDTLRSHISKPLHTIDDGLLPLFVRAAILCDGFTIKQKFNILKISRLECPEDLLGYVTEAEPAVSPVQSTPSYTTL